MKKDYEGHVYLIGGFGDEKSVEIFNLIETKLESWDSNAIMKDTITNVV